MYSYNGSLLSPTMCGAESCSQWMLDNVREHCHFCPTCNIFLWNTPQTSNLLSIYCVFFGSLTTKAEIKASECIHHIVLAALRTRLIGRQTEG